MIRIQIPFVTSCFENLAHLLRASQAELFLPPDESRRQADGTRSESNLCAFQASERLLVSLTAQSRSTQFAALLAAFLAGVQSQLLPLLEVGVLSIDPTVPSSLPTQGLGTSQQDRNKLSATTTAFFYLATFLYLWAAVFSFCASILYSALQSHIKLLHWFATLRQRDIWNIGTKPRAQRNWVFSPPTPTAADPLPVGDMAQKIKEDGEKKVAWTMLRSGYYSQVAMTGFLILGMAITLAGLELYLFASQPSIVIWTCTSLTIFALILITLSTTLAISRTVDYDCERPPIPSPNPQQTQIQAVRSRSGTGSMMADSTKISRNTDISLLQEIVQRNPPAGPLKDFSPLQVRKKKVPDAMV